MARYQRSKIVSWHYHHQNPWEPYFLVIHQAFIWQYSRLNGLMAFIWPYVGLLRALKLGEDLKTARGEVPPSSFIPPWSSWPSFWLFPELADNPSNRLILQPAETM